MTIRVSDRAAVRDFYDTVLAPLGREGWYGDLFGGFLLDPDGNNVEAVNHNR